MNAKFSFREHIDRLKERNMKQTLFIIFLISLLETAVSEEDFHLLSDKTERVIEAKIINYSPSSDKVVVELRTGKRVTVSASVFDKNSQNIIQGWNQSDLHASDKLLNFDFTLKLVRSSQTKQTSTSMDAERSSSVHVSDHNTYSHDIRVSNLSSGHLSLTNLVCSVLIEKNLKKDRYTSFDTPLSGNTISGRQSALFSTAPVYLIRHQKSKYPEIAGLFIKGEIITSSGVSIPFTVYENRKLERKIQELPHIGKYDPPGGQ